VAVTDGRGAAQGKEGVFSAGIDANHWRETIPPMRASDPRRRRRAATLCTAAALLVAFPRSTRRIRRRTRRRPMRLAHYSTCPYDINFVINLYLIIQSDIIYDLNKKTNSPYSIYNRLSTAVETCRNFFSKTLLGTRIKCPPGVSFDYG